MSTSAHRKRYGCQQRTDLLHSECTGKCWHQCNGWLQLKQSTLQTEVCLCEFVFKHWDTFNQDYYSTVGGDGGCRVGEVRASTTSPMPDHRGFKLQ